MLVPSEVVVVLAGIIGMALVKAKHQSKVAAATLGVIVLVLFLFWRTR